MSTAKHTPGPWRVHDRRDAPLKNIRIVGATGREVAQVSDVHQRDHLGGFKGDHQAHQAADAVDALGLANAWLLAAAPDLLAVVKEELKLYEGRDPSEYAPHAASQLRAMRAAVAKAEGTA